jgi:hypothetical protein
MQNNFFEEAEYAASLIPLEEILKYSGDWRQEDPVSNNKGVTQTVWTREIDSVEYQFASLTSEVDGKEHHQILPIKGVPIGLPIHKLEFIAQILFEGDRRRAASFAKSVSGQSSSWLSIFRPVSDGSTLELPELPDAEFETLVSEQKRRLMALEKARNLIAEEKYALHDQIPEPKKLSEWLLEEDVPLTYRIEELWPSEGTIFVVASYKAGKTTLLMNVIRCLTDGGPFLGRFETQPVTRNVGYLNFEVNEKQSKSWLKRLKIKNQDRLITWNLKGYGSPLATAISREKFTKKLIEKDIEVLIVDPFSGAYRKGETNDNDLVKEFLLQLDEVVRKAGVHEVLVAVHAGNDPNKPRGATTLGDHPDALWNIVKTEAGKSRFFKAEGRDVFLAEEGLSLSFDNITLELNGKTRADAAGESFDSLIKDFVAKSPDCSAGDIEAGITGKNSSISAARKRLVKDGVLIETQVGNAKRYRLAD